VAGGYLPFETRALIEQLARENPLWDTSGCGASCGAQPNAVPGPARLGAQPISASSLPFVSRTKPAMKPKDSSANAA